MSPIAGDLGTTTASTAVSINYAGQSQLIADGKLDVAATGQTGDYYLEDRTRYRIQDTESIQSLWSNGAWTETGHNFTVDHEAHNAWVYNQTVNLPKNSDPIITTNPDGSTSTQIIQLGQDLSTVTSAGGYDYHLIQSGSPTDYGFSLNHTSQSASGKHDTGTWQGADGSSGATYDNLGGQVHHTPAAKVTPFEYRKAPTVWMETGDHKKTASWGRSKAAQAYRDKQDALIRSSNLRESIQMDVDDFQSKFCDKYDANINQKLESFGFYE